MALRDWCPDPTHGARRRLRSLSRFANRNRPYGRSGAVLPGSAQSYEPGDKVTPNDVGVLPTACVRHTERSLQPTLSALGYRSTRRGSHPHVHGLSVPDDRPGGAPDFLEQANLSDEDQPKIGSGNWDRLCAKISR